MIQQDSLPLTRETQADKIEAFLLAGNTLTALSALERFRCLRVGARCWDLRQKGINVQSRIVETPSGKHIAEYFVPRDQPLIVRNGERKKERKYSVSELRRIAKEEAKSLEEQLLFSRLLVAVENTK